jgi:hypothetical protein
MVHYVVGKASVAPTVEARAAMRAQNDEVMLSCHLPDGSARLTYLHSDFHLGASVDKGIADAHEVRPGRDDFAVSGDCLEERDPLHRSGGERPYQWKRLLRDLRAVQQDEGPI